MNIGRKELFRLLSLLWIISTVIIYPVEPLEANSAAIRRAVTHQIGGGRLGDQLIGYLHAKWISYRYKIPLLYRPFPYSDQLVLDDVEALFQEEDLNSYPLVIEPKYGSKINYKKKQSALYIIPYFPEVLHEHTPRNGWYYFSVDWKNSGFKKEIKRLISPKHFTPKIALPEDRISVAVHVRLGGGFDSTDTWLRAPLKLPPIQYYIDQIKRLYGLLNTPLFVYIFTDDKNPVGIVQKMQEKTAGLDICYSCRTEENTHDQNVIQDLFEMTRFDCLIRPDSNYSIVASKISDYKVVISPLHFTWTDRENGFVDSVKTEWSTKPIR